MKISSSDVQKMAHLARLKVDDALVDKYAGQLNKILAYFDKLKEIDVDSAQRVSGASSNINVMRPDEVHPSPGPDVTLANAPERDDDFFQVPRVVK